MCIRLASPLRHIMASPPFHTLANRDPILPSPLLSQLWHRQDIRVQLRLCCAQMGISVATTCPYYLLGVGPVFTNAQILTFLVKLVLTYFSRWAYAYLHACHAHRPCFFLSLVLYFLLSSEVCSVCRYESKFYKKNVENTVRLPTHTHRLDNIFSTRVLTIVKYQLKNGGYIKEVAR